LSWLYCGAVVAAVVIVIGLLLVVVMVLVVVVMNEWHVILFLSRVVLILPTVCK